MRNRQTYEELLSVKSIGSQNLNRVALNSFERFTKEPIEKTIERIKDDEDEIFDTLNKWIAWNYRNGVTSTKQYFGSVNQFFYYMKIKLNQIDVRLNIKFPKKHYEELYPMKLEEVKRLLDVMPYKKRALYLAKLSSGMRINEICYIKKKDIDLSRERLMIKIPAKYTKTKRARTTFISLEASKMILPTLLKLNDNDRVWSNIVTISEGSLFSRYVDKAGLGDLKYETTGRRMINTHSFRAYFITKVSRYDRDLALILAGQGSKATELEYDRLSPEEKLDLYMKVEPTLIIDSTERDKVKMEEQKKEITELRSSKIKIDDLETNIGRYGEVVDQMQEQIKFQDVESKKLREIIDELTSQISY